MIEFVVNSDFDGKRVDLFIKSQEHEQLYSRALIEKLIDSQNVFINNQKCSKKSYLLKVNDVISVNTEQILQRHDDLPLIEDIPLQIVYEDKWLAVIDKPAGMTTHPAPGNHTGTLVNALLFHYPELQNDKMTMLNQHRPGIVHRLDKDTSGLMLIAKDDKTLFELSSQFTARQVKKTYVCVCVGVPNEKSGEINVRIGRHKTERKRMSARDDGKEAITHYEVIDDFEYFSLLQVKIETGRTHQIRVHLEYINHPVVGDNVYNSVKRTLSACPPKMQKGLSNFMKSSIHRQMLHSHKLTFTHPKSLKEMYFESEIPNDIQKSIDYLRKKVEQ